MRYSSGVRFSRAKPAGSFRVLQASTRRVASHDETLKEARKSAAYWTSAVGSPMEIQERFPSGTWTTVETVQPSRSHATRRDLAAVEEALGYTPDLGTIERAEAAHSDYSTNELRREIQSLEDQFEMAGGRGVGLADRLDAARIALALRGAKHSHATRKSITASRETSLLPPSVRVARAGLESMREHGIKNLRYGLYRHAGDRAYQWGNFTGTPEHVIAAIVPNAKNTASQEALVRALKWKR